MLNGGAGLVRCGDSVVSGDVGKSQLGKRGIVKIQQAVEKHKSPSSTVHIRIEMFRQNRE